MTEINHISPVTNLQVYRQGGAVKNFDSFSVRQLLI